MASKKVCVISGTRAEYGLLYWLMKGIESEPDLELQVIATAMHLSPEFGLTYETIESDGFVIDAKVEMLLSGDTPTSIAKSMGLGMISISEALDRLKPDLIVLLGDRFEALTAAQCAMLAKIPIAHIHGGEATEGLIDEAIRHSITKMSHLHFVAADEYRNRVIQLGEQPDRVFNFGAPGIENIRRLPLLSKEELETSLDFRLAEKNFLVTYHPVTLSNEKPAALIEELLSALDHFPEANVIITYPNADTSGRELIPLIESFAADRVGRVLTSTSLGQLRYLSALKYVDAVVGNSSSGIIEAPSFETPTVNIGNRQHGRMQARSVIQCGDGEQDIVSAIQLALSDNFIASLTGMKNPYGDGYTCSKIVEKLVETELENLVMKPFHDLEGVQ